VSEDLGPGPRTRVRRLPEKAAYDAPTIYSVLDEAPFCHVVAVVGAKAAALPTLCLREGSSLYFHGSPSNAVLRSVLDAGEAYVTATIYEGLRLARSGFESSVAYRSVVVIGRTWLVDDDLEQRRLLERFVDRVLPGRGAEVRPLSERERRLTLVVGVDIEEASAKISAGPTADSEEDQALPIWSGTVPVHLVYGEPIADDNGAMASGQVALPASVRRLFSAT